MVKGSAAVLSARFRAEALARSRERNLANLEDNAGLRQQAVSFNAYAQRQSGSTYEDDLTPVQGFQGAPPRARLPLALHLTHGRPAGRALPQPHTLEPSCCTTVTYMDLQPQRWPMSIPHRGHDAFTLSALSRLRRAPLSAAVGRPTSDLAR